MLELKHLLALLKLKLLQLQLLARVELRLLRAMQFLLEVQTHLIFLLPLLQLQTLHRLLPGVGAQPLPVRQQTIGAAKYQQCVAAAEQ